MRSFVGVLLGLLPLMSLTANPLMPTVVEGVADFYESEQSHLKIITGPQTIIHWDDFSIHTNEVTEFIQPDRHSVVLNRVVSDKWSEIYGVLESNGKVYLLNPNGIWIGEKGYIDTAAFIASTLNISNKSFLQNKDLLFRGENSASIINLGSIHTSYGDAVLIACHIQQEGELSAVHGVVGLAAGLEVLLKPEGQERLYIKASISDEYFSPVGINQCGAIDALQAELKADGNLYALAINQDGYIDANGILEEGGNIYLVAEGGQVAVAGDLYAQKNVNNEGGYIQILGKYLDLKDDLRVDVSGNYSGGSVLIGGSFKGEDPTVYASVTTVIGDEVSIYADAFIQGNGGRVGLWSNNETIFEGVISAQGGNRGGSGGIVALLSKQGYVDYTGLVNVMAYAGNPGSLILAPSIQHPTNYY